jgi:uncharacterized repeat protein (TIGR01451 family)
MSFTPRRSIALVAAAAALGLAALVPASAPAATADLTVTKADKPDPATVGEPLTYTLTVTNAGPDAATAVEVVDVLPNKVDFVSATTTQGNCEHKGKKVTCEVGTLADGETATIRIRVTPTREGEIVNTATVTTADTDPYAPNDTVSQTTTVGPAATPAEPACGGQKATIVGTKGADVLVGTPKRDVIVGLAGKDTIRGLGGKDLICGGRGNDLLKGGADDDVLRGGGGDDTLKGGAGDDVLKGGGADDTLKGGAGEDKLRGGGGNDALRGGTGNDSCRGGSGSDSSRSC